MPWRGPSYPGELPTLGYYVLDWFEENLVVPDGPTAGEPLVLTMEQAQFILKLYTINPRFTGPAIRGRALNQGRRVRRAVLSRPKGWGKSPIVAGLCLIEGLGDVVPDGWDAEGEPVGRPWESLGFKPKVQVIAVSEDQTVNTWDPLLEMAREGPIRQNYAIDPMETFVVVPRGRIEYATSAGTSREGFRPVFAALDQTESYTKTNGGIRLAATIRRNIGKVNGCSVETPNAFVPGQGSVAEKSYEAHQLQVEKKLKGAAGGILFDHREAPADTDPTDRKSALAGLRVAYGDSADVNGGWVALERILQEFWDPDTEVQDGRRYYFNQLTHAEDSWLSQPEWSACKDTEKGGLGRMSRRDPVVVGFDGSRKRSRGVTDATALVGCRVRDGHMFEIRVWEQPPDWPKDKDWRVPTEQVDTQVHDAFAKLNIVGFYADPAKWETYIASWEAKYGARLKIKASRDHPMEWWMTGGRSTAVVRATQQLHGAVSEKEMSHDGAAALTRHILNAHRREGRTGVQISKEHPDSARKIDAAVAAILAWQARLDALAAGLGEPKKTAAPKRIR